jgi:metallophosphoesterase (TIGR00282 family)
MNSITQSTHTLSVLCIGDVVGRPGRSICTALLRKTRQELGADLVIVNGENASGGLGIDPESAREFFDAGADIITLGDHAFQRKEARPYLDNHKATCIRPENYPAGAPGSGWTIITIQGVSIGIVNMMGRVFMNGALDCPFQAIDRVLNGPLSQCKIKILDMHAEATSEKIAMGRYIDGRASLQFGTHTHVQTADEQILPQGLGYITDLGMTGTGAGVIGMDTEAALGRFLSGLPHPYKVAFGPAVLSGIIAKIDTVTGRTIAINRIQIAEQHTHEKA